MNQASKVKQLKKIVGNTIHDKAHERENLFLMKRTGLSEREIVASYVQYDLNIWGYGNEFYESLAARMVLHLKYQQKESWHNERQRHISEILSLTGKRKMIDIGFGAPSRYVRDYIFKRPETELTLADCYESALTFADAILDYWNPCWKERITLLKHDMNACRAPAGHDLYIFQDSIEHIKNPEAYLKTIKEGSLVLFSLPICKKSGPHEIAWHTLEEARGWLELQGFKSVSKDCERIATVKPSIDLFAEQLDWNVQNYMCACLKERRKV